MVTLYLAVSVFMIHWGSLVLMKVPLTAVVINPSRINIIIFIIMLFLTASLAYLWIFSALTILALSFFALHSVKLKMDHVGLTVIAFYNFVFLGEMGVSIDILANDGNIPRWANIMTQVLKNMDIIFKAYFTFEMYRVRIWLVSQSPQELAIKRRKMRII